MKEKKSVFLNHYNSNRFVKSGRTASTLEDTMLEYLSKYDHTSDSDTSK